jgi:protocatechuate 3,4-dioxygenase beta subunit
MGLHGRALTDPEGRFTLAGLGDVEYELRFVVPRGFLAPEDPLRVRAGASDVVVRVTRGAVAVVTLLDERGEPVPRTRVRAVPAGRTLARDEELADEDDEVAGVALAVSDDDGRARLSGLAPGKACVLTVGNPEWQERVFAKQVEAWLPADTTVRLQRILGIRGRVLGDDGAPLAGADVRTEDRKHSARADAQGHFGLSGLVAGRYRLVAQHGVMPIGEAVEAATEAEGVVLRAPRGRDFRVHLVPWTPQWSDTYCRVIDAAGKGLGGGGHGDPDAQGLLRYEGYPPGSRLTFRLRTRGSAQVAVGRDLPIEEPATVRLEPGAEIRVRLIGPGGTKPENPGVAAASDDGLRLDIRMEADGTYVIQGLQRGERVKVTGWGGPRGTDRRAAWVTRLTDVEAGSTIDVEVGPR